MSGYQFIHLNSYSNANPKTRLKNGQIATTGIRQSSASDILSEASRDPGFHSHVDIPLPPKWHFGDVEAIELARDAWFSGTTRESKKGPRAIRSDSPWLAAGVISLPNDRINDWAVFRDYVIQDLHAKHGNRLRAVVEHLDETHPHLHFYLVPEPGSDFGTVHPGYAAKQEARKAGVKNTAIAYKAAMKKFQDDFHLDVGRPFGLARTGPKRLRETTAVWKIRQLEAKVLEQQTWINATKVQMSAAYKVLTSLEVYAEIAAMRASLIRLESAVLALDRQKMDAALADVRSVSGRLPVLPVFRPH